MVKLSKIYTRGGDKGETSLVGGTRLAKHDARVVAYGAVDETNAAIGMARLHTDGESDAMLARIQDDLFDLGADLATQSMDEGDSKEALRIVPEQVARLESRSRSRKFERPRSGNSRPRMRMQRSRALRCTAVCPPLSCEKPSVSRTSKSPTSLTSIWLRNWA